LIDVIHIDLQNYLYLYAREIMIRKYAPYPRGIGRVYSE
jgi:hypothetical protein